MLKIMKTKKVNGSKRSGIQNPVLIHLFSAVKGIVVTAIILLLVSFMVLKSTSFTMFTKLVIYLSVVVGAFLSGFVSHRKNKGKGYLCGALASLFYVALFIAISLVIMKFNVSVNLVLVIPIIAVSGVVGGIVSANT